MPDLPRRKAGIVACSGEELSEGTVTRLAALKVLHEMRPNDTVTICLPLFLAGGHGDRAFARFHPTITVDGCELRCAARATALYSGKPAASLVVNELIAERGMSRPEGRRCLNDAGRQAVQVTAERLAILVDQVLAKTGQAKAPDPGDQADPPQVTCSCGSGIPVTMLTINGIAVELIALPLIFQQYRQAGRVPDENLAGELLEAVKVYNAVPPDAEQGYRAAILCEYSRFCGQERAK